MTVIFLGFISLLAVFLFHFSEISSYQRQADSILQNSTYIPSVESQEKIANATSQDPHPNPDEKLAKLDKDYDYQFVIHPVHREYANDDSSQQTYDNGQHIHANQQDIHNIRTHSQENTGDLSTPNHYSNGQRMYYVIHIHIPYEDVTEKINGHNGSYEKDGSQYKVIAPNGFNHDSFAKTICQTSNDNNTNSHNN